MSSEKEKMSRMTKEEREQMLAKVRGSAEARVDRKGVWGFIINGLLTLSRWTYYVSMVIICLMLLMLFVDVAMRLTVGHSTDFGFEFTEYGLMWISILPAALYLFEEKHISVDFFYDKFSPGLKKVSDYFSLICVALMSFTVMWFGIKMTAGSFETGEQTNSIMALPLAWVEIWVPIAFGVMGLMAVVMIIDRIVYKKADKPQQSIAAVGTTD